MGRGDEVTGGAVPDAVLVSNSWLIQLELLGRSRTGPALLAWLPVLPGDLSSIVVPSAHLPRQLPQGWARLSWAHAGSTTLDL